MKKLPLFLLSLLFFIPQAQAASFPDVNELHPNSDAITYLKTQGVVQGNPDGNYDSEDRITKAAFTKILIEAIYTDEEINNCTTSDFADVPVGEWYAKYVCVAKKHNIVSGNPDGSFAPAGYIKFSEAAKIVAEAENIIGSEEGTNKEWYAKYVKGLEAKKAIPSTVSFFDQELTRGEMAEITYRIEADKTDKVSNSYKEMNETLPNISSCDALKEKMTNYLNRPIYYDDVLMPMADQEVMMDAVAAPSEAQTGGGLGSAFMNKAGSSDDYSQTNLQVEGVDEADIVKNDGKYIYMLKGDTVRIVQAYPPTDMKEVAKIDFNQDGNGGGFYPQELYVTDDRLVVLGQTSTYYTEPMITEDMAIDEKMIAPPYYNNKSQTKMVIYDISDAGHPKKLRDLSMDGNYYTSRRIGDQVYLILNASPNYWNWDMAKGNVNDLLPMFKDGSLNEQKMVNCTDIRYFPGYSVPQYLITAAINIDDAKSPVNRDVYLGSTENVYASPTDLFVATTVMDADRYTDWNWMKDKTTSHVFRFSLDAGKINFVAAGEVPGRSLNQFSMDQHDNHFRIATTTGNIWDWNDQNTSKNNVYVLDDKMKVTGKLENLAPGEQIYSTRFVGDRLYMVTFEQVDPLFVIDLSDPKTPKTLGQLKIPGFSEYLHPYDENHLIGFGQETSSDDDQVQIKGFKMSMFDVTDVKNPKEQDKVVIGDSGTYSELLYNHKALLFDKEKELLAFPIQIQELVQPEEMQCNTHTSSTCPYNCIQACVIVDGKCADVAGSCVAPTYEQYENTFSGAIVYNVNLQDGFTEKGRISNIDQSMMNNEDYWNEYYNNAVQRIIYIGDYLYTIAQGSVKASNLDDVKEVDKVKLEGDEDYYYGDETVEG